MPDSGWVAVTGDTITTINGGVEVNLQWIEYEFTLIDNPKVRKTGTNFPLRLQYAGSLQAMTDVPTVAGPAVWVPAFDWPLVWEKAELAPPTMNYGALGIGKIRALLPPSVNLSWRAYW